MEMFSTFDELATRIAVPRDPRRGFERERDWGIMRGRGFGRRGDAEHDGGWLVTFAVGRTTHTGWLVAYEVDESNRRTGGCLLLAGPMTEDQDHQLLEEAQREPWYRSRPGGADVDVELELAPWLADRLRTSR